jgi:hypothetical protein
MKLIVKVLPMIFLLGCGKQVLIKEIDLGDYTEVEITDEHTNIELIKSYENFECKGDQINSNVYQCVLDSGDTLFVFELCKKMPDFAKNDYEYKADLDLIIDKRNVQLDFQKRINIPAEVSLGQKGKFIVGSITRLEY